MRGSENQIESEREQAHGENRWQFLLEILLSTGSALRSVCRSFCFAPPTQLPLLAEQMLSKSQSLISSSMKRLNSLGASGVG